VKRVKAAKRMQKAHNHRAKFHKRLWQLHAEHGMTYLAIASSFRMSWDEVRDICDGR
jgi:hypothetical protein